MLIEDEFEKDLNLSKTGSDQDFVQKGPSTDDGDNNANDGMDESELFEDDAATDTTTDTTTDTKSDTGSTIKPWESGAARGPGNKLGVQKWESGITKGPGNKTATEKWSSGRKYGPTGNNYV